MNLLTFTAPRAPHVDLGGTAGIAPLDPARSSASGPAPYRVLVVGGDAVAGRGVLTHDLAVTGALARSLGRQVGHGVDVETVVEPEMTVDAAETAVWSARLTHYDALVLVLEHDRPGRGAEDSQRRLRGLLIDAASLMPDTSTVTVAVAPAIRPPHHAARDVAAFLDHLRSAADGIARVVELPVPDAPVSPIELYTAWGDAIASATAEGLHEPALWTDARDAVDEGPRTRAVARLTELEDEWEGVFRRFVAMAGAAYGTRSASITVIDSDLAHYSVCQSWDEQAIPRDETICERTMSTYGGVIVGDARLDPRFADLPCVVNGDVAFYAGYRINDLNGVPVAVLCVFDSEARDVLGQDIALLRDFALAAERRLGALLRERSSASRGVAKV